MPPTDKTGVEEILNLEFGYCRLQVQVPEKGNITKPEELIGKNIVTSFTNLAEEYFRGLEDKQDDKAVNGDGKRKLRTNIKYVGGSVEAACALGVADGIVDLVGRLYPLHSLDTRRRLTRHRIRRDDARSRPQSNLHRPRNNRHPHKIKAALRPEADRTHRIPDTRCHQ